MATSFDLTVLGAGLAFAAHVEELDGLLPGGACVIHAPPGSGKTTLVPPVVANHLTRSAGPRRVIVTGPRRISVRAAATRLAHLDGSQLGDRVGYTIRGERHRSRETVVEFLTPGVLLRRLISAPELDGVGAVILDEVHERSLEGDLLLAMLAELRELRADLIVVAMSATLQTRVFAELLGQAPVLHSSGEQYPITVTHVPPAGPRFDERGVARGFLEHVAQVTGRALADASHPDDDVLVFLPGRAEITYVSERIARTHPGLDVLPLHSGVTTAAMGEILAGRRREAPRRVVLATSVAESSLTVPGIRIVVDSCLAREPRRDARRGMTGLVTISASRASSEQRAGRAGRLGPGAAYRCISEAAYAAVPAAPTPEITTADLTSAALFLACWGTPGGAGMTLPDPLPERALESAHLELCRIGALGEDLQPTNLGRTLAKLPVDPRLGRALLVAARAVSPRRVSEVVAMLGADLRTDGADLPGLLRELRAGRHRESRRWRQEAHRLERLLRGNPVDLEGAAQERVAPDQEIGYIAALASGQLAKLEGGSYLLASGTRASLPPGSPLTGHPWLVITDLSLTRARAAADTGAMIHAAVPISRELLEEIFPPRTIRQVRVSGGRVIAREERRFDAIVDSATPRPSTAAENATAITEYVRARGLSVLPWTPEVNQLRGRLAAARATLGEEWPDVSDEALTDSLEWLTAHITEPEVARVPLGQALETLVWHRRGELDRIAPRRITLPSGRSMPLDYSLDGEITGRAKLQECFGMATTPTVLGVPVTLELLSPAGRPLAITRDLRFFWEEVYPQVRAENRARYAKHPWPEDPWSHPATTATTRQLQNRR